MTTALKYSITCHALLLRCCQSRLGKQAGKARGLAFFRRSKEERMERREKRKERRGEIFKRMREGGGLIKDLNDLRQTSGKRLHATSSLCSNKEAVLFPTLTTHSLNGNEVVLPAALKGSPSLIVMFMKTYGMNMSEQYRLPFVKAFGGLIPVYQVNVLELRFLRLLRRVIEANLRREIENDRHETFLCYYGNFYEIKRTLDIHNSLVSFAFLLDNKGFVRWRCHGNPTEQEIKYLIKCGKDILVKKKKFK